MTGRPHLLLVDDEAAIREPLGAICSAPASG